MLKTSILANADGSAELTDGPNRVIVSVNGPIEPKPKQELPNLASLEIIVRPSMGLSTTRENLIVDKLRSILSTLITRYRYPSQLIQIVVQVLITETDSVIINNFEETVDELKFFNLELSTIVNCCFFALLDANIGLYESFIALNHAIIDSQVVESPTLAQVVKSSSTHLVVLSVKDNKPHKLIYIDSKGAFSEQELYGIIDFGYDKAVGKFHSYRQLIEDAVSSDFKWRHLK